METLGAVSYLVVLADHHTIVFDSNNTVYNCVDNFSSIACDKIDHRLNKKAI
jgi:hypothetical protein